MGHEPPNGLAWSEGWHGGIFVARTPYRRLYGLALFMLGVAVTVPYAAFVPSQGDPFVLAVTTPFALVAVWFVYNGLAFLFGAARIRLGRGALDIAWRPLPAPGGKHMPTAGVVGFEARARAAGRPLTWVAARIAGSGEPRFVMQLFEEEHAEYVVARLNAALAQLTRSGG